jgi:hypothetical protein
MLLQASWWESDVNNVQLLDRPAAEIFVSFCASSAADHGWHDEEGGRICRACQESFADSIPPQALYSCLIR